MSALIPSLSKFYHTELRKKPSELVKELNKEIDASIKFFDSQYIENPAELDAKYDIFLSQGYMHLNKILSYVEILPFADQSQTNKFIYEDCYANCIGVTKSVNSFHELKASELVAKFNRLVDYSKIASIQHDLNIDLTIKANEYMEDILADIRKQNVDIYNNYINQFIMSLVKITVILSQLND